jgi:hypothetical protein
MWSIRSMRSMQKVPAESRRPANRPPPQTQPLMLLSQAADAFHHGPRSLKRSAYD